MGDSHGQPFLRYNYKIFNAAFWDSHARQVVHAYRFRPADGCGGTILKRVRPGGILHGHHLRQL